GITSGHTPMTASGWQTPDPVGPPLVSTTTPPDAITAGFDDKTTGISNTVDAEITLYSSLALIPVIKNKPAGP
ncbi:MAG: hypothetical protein KDI15_07075, partial [Thiothrix sp.]|nr:hypothetical protein [Thiothrix sp.]